MRKTHSSRDNLLLKLVPTSSTLFNVYLPIISKYYLSIINAHTNESIMNAIEWKKKLSNMRIWGRHTENGHDNWNYRWRLDVYKTYIDVEKRQKLNFSFFRCERRIPWKTVGIDGNYSDVPFYIYFIRYSFSLQTYIQSSDRSQIGMH